MAAASSPRPVRWNAHWPRFLERRISSRSSARPGAATGAFRGRGSAEAMAVGGARRGVIGGVMRRRAETGARAAVGRIGGRVRAWRKIGRGRIPWEFPAGLIRVFAPLFRAVRPRGGVPPRPAPSCRSLRKDRLPANERFRRRRIVPDDGILGPSPVEVLARRGFSGRSGRMSSRVKAPQTFRKHLSNAGLMCPADRVASVSTGARSRASGGAGRGIGAQASASRSPESSGREGKLSFASAREAGYPRASLPGAVPEGSRRRPARQQRRFT